MRKGQRPFNGGRFGRAEPAEQGVAGPVATLPRRRGDARPRPQERTRSAEIVRLPPPIADAVATNKKAVAAAVMDRLDVSKAAQLSAADLAWQLHGLVGEVVADMGIHLNKAERQTLVRKLVDDMIGLGPLEPLLADDEVADILVNGPDRVYVERNGRLERTAVAFHDHCHVLNVALRIAVRAGRRVDETTPMVDARLADGSRVNIVIPPLAIDGPTISIRKFVTRRLTLRDMARQGNLSEEMAAVLMVAARSRANVLISGGTGSGKTTLLNALSEVVDAGERIVTIEDAAELQLQQPHVVRLETRMPNLEGDGEVRIRDLLRNALRMRPDRIIVGEVRGDEVVDMLQAMNTGHDGSLGTIHANSPRDALTRLEHLVAMAGLNLPVAALRAQIASAVHLVVHVARLPDGARRITHITEVVGVEGDTILTQDLFSYQRQGTAGGGFVGHGIKPRLTRQAQYHGLDRVLAQAMHGRLDAPAA